MARFSREDIKTQYVPGSNNGDVNDFSGNLVGKTSYAQVLSGDKITVDKEVKLESKSHMSNVNIACNVDQRPNYPLTLIDCYKEFRSIESTCSICQGEGFTDVEFLYVSVRWVLLDFSSAEIKD